MKSLNEILGKYKLLEEFEVEISNKDSFINQLNMMVSDGFYHPIFFIFDTFFKTPSKYVGQINDRRFKIRDKFNGENALEIKTLLIRGEFKNIGNEIKLKIIIKSMSIIQLIIHFIILLIYAIVILLSIIEALLMPPLPDSKVLLESYLLPCSLITLFVICFTLIPFNMCRRNLKIVKNDFKESIELINKNILQQGL